MDALTRKPIVENGMELDTVFEHTFETVRMME